MTRRVYLTPPIAVDLFCRNCGNPIVAAAKVVYDDGRPDWFVYQHATGAESCPALTVAEPFDEAAAHAAVEALFVVQATVEGGTAARSAQAARVDDVLARLFNAEHARRGFVAAGDKTSAGEAAGALRGVIEDLPLHDLRSLTLRLFLRAAKDGAR